jgi:hypothetical protein
MEDISVVEDKHFLTTWIGFDNCGSGPVAENCEHASTSSGFMKGGEFHEQLRNWQLSKICITD